MSERERKLREYEEARRREEAARTDRPYRPGRMKVRMPVGCAVAATLAVLAVAVMILRLIRRALGW